MAPPLSGQVDDLASLPTLDEKTLLQEIQTRYHRDIIYTYIGDILVSVNPYKPFDIYGLEFQQRYGDLKFRQDLLPHVFAVSDRAYQNIRLSGAHQCCIVSGESGAGKTETTKLLLEHIVYLSKQNSECDLHQKIIKVNPLLEAFGNAQTVANDNSSRFGKYIEVKFNSAGEIVTAFLSEYLLEKSRVVSQAAGERNFHMFYYMFAGLTQEELNNNLLDRPEKHRILRPVDGSQVYANEAAFVYHQRMWDELRETLDIVGFLPEDIHMMLALMAAILHITDLSFDADPDTDGVYIVDEKMLELAAMILGIFPEDLATSLISSTSILRGEKIISLKTIEQANNGRDALAKALYSRLFGWIVRQINYMLHPPPGVDIRTAGPSIGVLDIAGFENFERNSFEQLCINVTNEQLQFYFNQHVFQWELDEYKREGVKVKDIKFTDNKDIVNLFLESPLGFFSLLDEESRFPKASDATLLEKLSKNLGKKNAYVKPKGQNLNFKIKHYAGEVVYEAERFLEKNRDQLSTNLLECMRASDSQIVSDLFAARVTDLGHLEMNPDAPKRSRKSILLCKAPPDLSITRNRSLSKKAGKKVKEGLRAREAGGGRARDSGGPVYENTLRTLAGHFRNSLTDLMSKLSNTEPHFIRCIKPNRAKRANLFEPENVSLQLRYTGIMETIRIRRIGFSTRLPVHIFVDRFRFITFSMTSKIEFSAATCIKILKSVNIKDYEIGKTKVFLKYWHTERLNAELDRVGLKIVRCQAFMRAFVARNRVRHMINCSLRDASDAEKFMMFVSQMSDKQTTLNDALIDEDKDEYRKKIERIKNPHENVQTGGMGTAKPGDNHAIYMATPIMLGNPITKTAPPAPLKFNQQRKAPSIDEDLAYITETLRSPTAAISSPVHNLPPHLARPPPTSPSPASQTNNRAPKTSTTVTGAINISSKNYKYSTVILEFLNETLHKYPGLVTSMNNSVWGKAYYIEKNDVIAKVYLVEDEIIIDNSTQDYDGSVFGLGAYPIKSSDANVKKWKNGIGKGVKLTMNLDGSISATRLSQNDVIVKGYTDPDHNCLSQGIVDTRGRLDQNSTKQVFDMQRYTKHIADQLDQPEIDQTRLKCLTTISMAFGRNTFDDMDTPCWLCVINFRAIDKLGREDVFYEAKRLANIELGYAAETQLKRNWKNVAVNPLNDNDRPPPTNPNYNGTANGQVKHRDSSPEYHRSISSNNSTTSTLDGFGKSAPPPVKGKTGNRLWAKKTARPESQL